VLKRVICFQFYSKIKKCQYGKTFSTFNINNQNSTTCPLPTTTETLFLKVGYLLDLNKNFRPNIKHKTPHKTIKLVIIIKKKLILCKYMCPCRTQKVSMSYWISTRVSTISYPTRLQSKIPALLLHQSHHTH